jgi:hypothetical protein
VAALAAHSLLRGTDVEYMTTIGVVLIVIILILMAIMDRRV